MAISGEIIASAAMMWSLFIRACLSFVMVTSREALPGFRLNLKYVGSEP